MLKLHRLLKAARHKKKMTLRDVEQESGFQVSNPYISALENGRERHPHPEKLRILCRVLDIKYLSAMIAAGYIKKRDLR